MSERSERRRAARERFKNEQGYVPPVNSHDGGEGFLGGSWHPQAGVTFLGSGAFVRSVINPESNKGMVVFDLGGKWNKGAEDTLSVILHRDVAMEIGQYLIEGAKAAKKDEERWKKM